MRSVPDGLGEYGESHAHPTNQWLHWIEGKRPSFFKDLQVLLIGPLWWVAAPHRRLGVSY